MNNGSGTINADKINVSEIKIGDLNGASNYSTTTQMNTAISNAVDDISIGGRNLLHGTSTMTAGDGRWDTSRTFRASGGALSNVTTSGLPIRGVSGALRVTNTGSSAAQIGFAQDRVEGLLTGETYTQGAWVRASTTVNVFHQPIYKDASRYIKGAPVSIGTDWTYISHTGTLTGTQATDFYSAGYMYASAVPANGWFEVCGLKLEKGTKATDWTPAPEDQEALALSSGIEYIAGTQTAATNVWTGVTKETALVAGKTIAYHLPFAGTSTAATLTLTLANGNTTAAIGIKFNSNNSAANNVTTHFGAGSVINMTYDGTYWRVSASYYDTTGISNARYRTQNPNAIKAAAACTSGHIICGTSSGYRNVAANVSFDLNYALMWCGTDIAANGTGTNNYLTYNGVNVKTSGTVESVTQYSTVYLKGTVDGKTFKIAASNFLTCKVPTSDDGFAYIPLGIAYNTTPNIYFNSSSDVYAFRNGAFQKLDSVAKYITAITDSGIRVHAKSNPTENYAQIDADGLDVIKGGVSVAQFGKSDQYGPSTRIGQESKTHITIATSVDTSGSSESHHEKIDGSEIKLYNIDGTKANLKLYDSTMEEYDDGNSTHYNYEVVGIDFGERGNKSIFDVTGENELSTGSTIRSFIEEGATSATRLEILTGNTQSQRSASTHIESARQ